MKLLKKQYIKRFLDLEDYDIDLSSVEIVGRGLDTDRMMDAFNRKEKTLLVKLHLDRSNADLKRDVCRVCDRARDVLAFVAEYEREMGLKVPALNLDFEKRPRTGVYKDCLRVYDRVREFKKNGQRVSWVRIAGEIFPDEVKDSEAHWRRSRKVKLARPEAVSKVRHYYDVARRILEEE